MTEHPVPAADDSPPLPHGQASVADHAAPQFGLLDVVEAFTAMRHEWRAQARESRQFTDSMRTSTDLLVQIESTLDQKLATITDDGSLKRMISTVIELDISLQRAVDATAAIAAPEVNSELIEQLRQSYNKSGFFNRWFSRAFYRKVIATIESGSKPKPDATAEGIRLVLERLRRMMDEQSLVRVETTGKPFDAETMTAIASVVSAEYAVGLVAEEITPAYFYRNKLVRYAEVRVSVAASGQ